MRPLNEATRLPYICSTANSNQSIYILHKRDDRQNIVFALCIFASSSLFRIETLRPSATPNYFNYFIYLLLRLGQWCVCASGMSYTLYIYKTKTHHSFCSHYRYIRTACDIYVDRWRMHCDRMKPHSRARAEPAGCSKFLRNWHNNNNNKAHRCDHNRVTARTLQLYLGGYIIRIAASPPYDEGASSSQHTSSAGRFSFCTPQNTASNLTTTPTTSCSNTYTQPTAHKYICICVFRPNKLFSLEIMADIAVWKRRLRRVLMLGFCLPRVRTAGLSRIENQTNERLFAALTFRAHSLHLLHSTKLPFHCTKYPQSGGRKTRRYSCVLCRLGWVVARPPPIDRRCKTITAYRVYALSPDGLW